MKFITFLFVIAALNCQGQMKYHTLERLSSTDTAVKWEFIKDTVPGKNGVITTPINWSTNNTTLQYRFVIRPYGRTKPCAYLDKDSVLTVSDSL
jgi:hypothetical protein